jgi:hypothetical protein
MQIVNPPKQHKIAFLPLRSVDIHVEITESVALIMMTQEYINPTDPEYCFQEEHAANPQDF